MLFTDPSFLFYFLPFALVLHRLALGVRKPDSPYPTRARAVLFALTLVFYGFYEPWWVLPFLACLGFDFLWASLISRASVPFWRRVWLVASVAQNLGLLIIFKYWDSLVRSLWPSVPHLTLGEGPLPLPPGVSFYTFESLSFVIDVYRRELRPPKKPLEFFAFLGMFPRFIAGPIVRYREMLPQFRNYSGMQVEEGLATFIHGFALKVCLADPFGAFVKYAFDRNGAVEFLSAWIGVLAYTFQIYFDFCGYSLMAIGLGLCLGFEFPANFNRPYLSSSLKEFWTRWHMTLSRWLRDYLYISLGGNRRGKWRTYFNLILTMSLGGLWHGSGWTFLIWGVWHGVWLCVEKATGATSRILTAGVVVVGWVFFRASTAAEAFTILRAMVTPWSHPLLFNPEGIFINPLNVVFCGMGIFFIFGMKEQWPRLSVPALAAVFLFALTMVLSTHAVPFLYFQF